MEQRIEVNDLLAEELAQRMSRNQRYSLRAFARDISISPAFLVQIMNHKRNLTDEKAAQIAEKMRWKGSRARLFVNLARLNRLNSVDYRQTIEKEIQTDLAKVKPHRRVPGLKGPVLIKWYYHAVLELINLKGFKSDLKWIAQKLGIRVEQAREVIELGLEKGFIKETDRGWKRTEQMIEFDYPNNVKVKNQAIREFFDISYEKLASKPKEERVVYSMLVALDLEKIQEFRKNAHEFMVSLNSMSEPESSDRLALALVSLVTLDGLEKLESTTK